MQNKVEQESGLKICEQRYVKDGNEFNFKENDNIFDLLDSKSKDVSILWVEPKSEKSYFLANVTLSIFDTKGQKKELQICPRWIIGGLKETLKNDNIHFVHSGKLGACNNNAAESPN